MRPTVENWHKLNCRLVWAYEGPVSTQFRTGTFPPEAIAAWLILRGWVRLTFAHSTEICRAGNWYIPKAEGWTQEFSADAEILSMRFIAEWPDTSPLFDQSKSRIIPEGKVPRLAAIARRLARYTRDHQIKTTKDGIEHVPKTLRHYVNTQRLFLDWLVVYVDLMHELGVAVVSHQPLDERIWMAVNRMARVNLHENVREEEFARLVGVSKSHFARLFVGNMGMTPAEYRERRRINAACSALLESDRSVKTIAYELGFSSLSHFSSWMRKKAGCSPREFRKDPQRADAIARPLRGKEPSPVVAPKNHRRKRVT